jgi:hypothetical protein
MEHYPVDRKTLKALAQKSREEYIEKELESFYKITRRLALEAAKNGKTFIYVGMGKELEPHSARIIFDLMKIFYECEVRVKDTYGIVIVWD